MRWRDPFQSSIRTFQVGSAGRKSRLLLSMSAAREFRDHLTSFSELYASLGPPNVDNCPEDGKIKSEVIIKENRRYFLDLKENPRGRFLRVSQSISHGGPRSQIAIPAQGMIEFRDALTDLLEEFGGDEGSKFGDGEGDEEASKLPYLDWALPLLGFLWRLFVSCLELELFEIF